MISYNDEVFRFSDKDLIKYIEKAKIASSISTSTNNFKVDLVESICLIQFDGTEFSFTHRSFQEYFAALCISGLPDDYFIQAVAAVSRRSADNILTLLHGIAPIRFHVVAASHFIEAACRDADDTMSKRIASRLFEKGVSISTFCSELDATDNTIGLFVDIHYIAQADFIIAYARICSEIVKIKNSTLKRLPSSVSMETIDKRKRELASYLLQTHTIGSKNENDAERRKNTYYPIFSLEDGEYSSYGRPFNAKVKSQITEFLMNSAAGKRISGALEVAELIRPHLLKFAIDKKKKISDIFC